MNAWTAAAAIVVLVALTGAIAATRLVSDAAGDLARSAKTFGGIRAEVDGLATDLARVRQRGPRTPASARSERDEGPLVDR